MQKLSKGDIHTPFFSSNIKLFNTLERGNNTVVFSSLKEFYHPVKSEGFAIKYVVEGLERYTLNGREYFIDAGKYLLSNLTHEGHVEIQSNKSVQGICINILPEILAEVAASRQRPDTAYSDVELGRFFCSTLFLEHQKEANQTQLGRFLLELAVHSWGRNLDEGNFNIEFFYACSEKIIADQIPIFKQLQSIPTVKATTKKELYRRISKGKEFIDAYFLSPLTVGTVAKAACMSEYHFFRIFKSVFNLSPNQYLIQKRLEYGLSILQQDKNSVSIAAIEAGFSDIHAFSKAFKMHFGYSPSAVMKPK